VLTDGHMPGRDGFDFAHQIRRDPRFASTSILMLTSFSRNGDASRCKAPGIDACLAKPIAQRELREAMLQALGRVRSAPDAEEKQAGERRRNTNLRILLAEDNPVNQRLILRMLQKEGFTVDVACNGRDCLAGMQRTPYDLVLMDVQMPEMDGFERRENTRDGTRFRAPCLHRGTYGTRDERGSGTLSFERHGWIHFETRSR
jgi:CheY-like chemotaxis protein